ncbi:hypothetical protein HPP92_017264 [Vanilla planifolia]|uniref:Uncharacterized protein n=1 Tax=Vanilla planifolia TaxID=51239 RepID=A0A835UQE9_VANPL|nr:hypothetical protein HPP92_017264 [Vanilla planifolia]
MTKKRTNQGDLVFVTYKTAEDAKKAIDDPNKILGEHHCEACRYAAQNKGMQPQVPAAVLPIAIPLPAAYTQPGKSPTRSSTAHVAYAPYPYLESLPEHSAALLMQTQVPYQHVGGRKDPVWNSVGFANRVSGNLGIRDAPGSRYVNIAAADLSDGRLSSRVVRSEILRKMMDAKRTQHMGVLDLPRKLLFQKKRHASINHRKISNIYRNKEQPSSTPQEGRDVGEAEHGFASVNNTDLPSMKLPVTSTFAEQLHSYECCCTEHVVAGQPLLYNGAPNIELSVPTGGHRVKPIDASFPTVDPVNGGSLALNGSSDSVVRICILS